MKNNLANFSPVVFAAACGLLAMIITVFAVANYQREKELMEDALFRQTDVVKRIVYGSLKKSIRDNLTYDDAKVDLQEHLQRATEQAKEQRGVRSVLIVRGSGQIVAGAVAQTIGTMFDDSDRIFLEHFFNESGVKEQYRFKNDSNDADDSFQAVMRFDPMPNAKTKMKRPRHPMMRQHSGERGEVSSEKIFAYIQQSIGDKKTALLIDLEVDYFNIALKQQRKQIIVLSVVLLLVGVGGWLSLLTLQGFKGSQLKLSQMRVLTDHLISSLPIGLVCLDTADRIKFVNQAAINFLPLQHALVGVPLEDVLDAEWWQVVCASRLDNSPIEIKSSLNNDLSQVISVRVVEVKNEVGGGDGYVVLLQDLTEQKELEHELQTNVRLASLGKMAAGVAHELRNPLSSIKGLGTLLRSRFAENSDDWQTAQVLVDEVDRLNRSIGELLDYAKPREVMEEIICLQESVNKAISLVIFDVKAVAAEMKVDFPPEKILLKGNLDKLNQVFLNLLLNSIQSLDGHGAIELMCEIESGRAVITITDNGCGVSDADLPHVFDPYFTTKVEGTGLGLAISSKIIEEHGGELVFASQEGTGSTVTIRLPFLSA